VADVRDPQAVAVALQHMVSIGKRQKLNQDYVSRFSIERISAAWADLFKEIAKTDTT